MIKQRMMRWTYHAACMRETRNAGEILIEKQSRKESTWDT